MEEAKAFGFKDRQFGKAIASTAGNNPSFRRARRPDKPLVLGPLKQGDCTMDDATIWLSSDETGIFSAYTITSDDGDVWICRPSALVGQNGLIV
jgi:hypothetical protein